MTDLEPIGPNILMPATISAFITWVELQFPRTATEICARVNDNESMSEEGDPPDAHQHVDPMPFDYNLDRTDRMGRLVIRHNFH